MKNKKQLLIYSLLIVGGILIGWILFGGTKEKSSEPISIDKNIEQKATIWTCSMHPQIRKDGQGKCPICGMDLIPLNNEEDETAGDNQIQLSESAMKIAEVQTSVVLKSTPVKEIRLSGKIKPDERKVEVITARFAGRIEKLFVNFTGQQVQKGEKLATVYSPDLITAQKELFEAIKFKQTNPEYYKAAKNKLKLWSLSDKQIENMEQNGEPQNYFDILSPLSGTVLKKEVALGDYLAEGMLLFELADLSSVWVLFDAYESDLPWIRNNDKVTFELQSQPGKQFSNTITFIDPVVNAETRVAAVRTEINNSDNLLKPEMFVAGLIQAKLPNIQNALLIPKSSVLWTGKKAVVYVKIKEQTKPTFEYREITLGEDAGNFYVVKEGLQEGEEIVTNGTFKIDAAAQLAGKQSMMNPLAEEDKTSSGHQHSEKIDMKKEVEKNTAEISSKFKQQLGNVINSYLLLKDKLVSDNSNIKTEVKEVITALTKVDMSLVKDNAHNLWMKTSTHLSKDLKTLEKVVTIDEQRKLFSSISNELIKISEQLGLEMPNKTSVYIDFCPMANDNKGDYWLSAEKEIKNPYFGKKMLKCGSIKSVIK